MNKYNYLDCFIQIHGDRYDYSEFVYKNSSTKSKIRCKKHGIFEQTPSKHKIGRGCPDCGNEKRNLNKTITHEKFNERFKAIIPDNFEILKYEGYRKNSDILCKKHNVIFKQTPERLSKNIKGCKLCQDKDRGNSLRIDYEVFKSRAIVKHGFKFIYPDNDYKNMNDKIRIICRVHGDIYQTMNNHLKHGCKQCTSDRYSIERRKNIDEIVKSLNKFGKNLTYPFIEDEYVNAHSKITVRCKEHGDTFQSYNNHFKSKGCKKCSFDLRNDMNKDNPSGWRYSYWQKISEVSKNFDSFKVYIIKCYNDSEIFYKIGKTFRKVNERFKNKKDIPYEIEVLKEYVFEDARECSEFEIKLLKNNKDFKYNPLITFKGCFECFDKIIEI